MMGQRGIQVTCKKCNRQASADSFVLDGDYRMMVCPNCIKDRRDKRSAEEIAAKRAQTKQEEVSSKPAGWDAEDAYLEKVQKQKDSVNVNFQRVDSERIKYTCPKCKYVFTYNTVRKHPGSCPYCRAAIYTFKFK